MDATNVRSILAAFREAGVAVWIGGGWGVDALLGEQTRPHRDLDLVHRVEQEERLLAVLGRLGYAETLDWRPVRFVVADPEGRDIDLHPLRFAADGSAEQSSLEEGRPFRYPASCFTTGLIEGATVPCLSAEQQAEFHRGYEPAEHDLADMRRLREAFGVATRF